MDTPKAAQVVGEPWRATIPRHPNARHDIVARCASYEAVLRTERRKNTCALEPVVETCVSSRIPIGVREHSRPLAELLGYAGQAAKNLPLGFSAAQLREADVVNRVAAKRELRPKESASVLPRQRRQHRRPSSIRRELLGVWQATDRLNELIQGLGASRTRSLPQGLPEQPNERLVRNTRAHVGKRNRQQATGSLPRALHGNTARVDQRGYGFGPLPCHLSATLPIHEACHQEHHGGNAVARKERICHGAEALESVVEREKGAHAWELAPALTVDELLHAQQVRATLEITNM